MISTSQRLCVAFFLADLDGGGTERAVVGLANSIVALGIGVDLVLSKAAGPCLAEVAPAVRVVDLGSRGKLGTVLSLARYLRGEGPQAVMSALDLPNIQLVLAAALARFQGVTVISQRATIAPVYAGQSLLRRIAYHAGIRATYSRADRVICNSHAAAKEVEALPGVRSDRVLTIHNSVDAARISQLAKEPVLNAWLEKTSGPLIVSVGSITAIKDRATLVRAFALVKANRAARLAIVGHGHEAAELSRIQRLIAELGLHDHVHLAGFDPNPYRWMQRAAVVVSSSLTEGCPNQVLEALALGVSVVATDCPGDTGVLLQQGRYGRLVPVADPDSMAAAIAESLDSGPLADGKSRAADFSPARTARAYLKVLLPALDLQAAGLLEPS
jgi:glycosyltransferase involved in cell wall biosynthesis